jgi:squalene-hopene/tetraprenyl-beta-curcumene cyclase
VPADVVTPERVRDALDKATAALVAQRDQRGFWEGELSSSALSTATAVTALALGVQHGAFGKSEIRNPKSEIDAGLKWLAAHANADGGWGDTTKSLSNISTTTLCWAAFGAASADEVFPAAVRDAERWLSERVGVAHSALRTSHSALARAIITRYGKDRTFSVPILTMCALAGRLGSGRDAWRHVIPLPFELAACPHQLFAALRLPVVSYALPALIAIGQARHVHAPSRNPVARTIRNLTREKTLRVLTEIQPGNGGFLEATPLTGFVTMSLAGSGQADHAVTRRGLDFLRKSQRADGSWPIDTNLATWCTTLAVDALHQSAMGNPQSTIDWLLHQQHRIEHPYTHAAPGGWAWTDLPGGVPDADDTAGALVALAKLRNVERGKRNEEIIRAAEAGVRWLLDLQNRDGGIPTFCRGWGALPFDRSSPDITAHALRAWLAWQTEMPPPLQRRIERALSKALNHLIQCSRENGAYVPLWFGNQFAPEEENCTYGTSRVILAMFDYHRAKPPSRRRLDRVDFAIVASATPWLIEAQHASGAWSGGMAPQSSIEETALAVHALARVLEFTALFERDLRRDAVVQAVKRGTKWLLAQMESGEWTRAAPIGFYFAKLWYFERLYPLIFTVGALRAVSELDV